jgi:hypothetical protein
MDICNNPFDRGLKGMIDDTRALTPANEEEEILLQRLHNNGGALNPGTWLAVSIVLRASCADADWSTELRLRPHEAKRLWLLSHLTGSPSGEADCFHDKVGRLVLSAHTALRLARALAAADPGRVREFAAKERLTGLHTQPKGDDDEDSIEGFVIVMGWTTPKP